MINVNTGGNLAPTPREQFFTWELDAQRTMSLKVNDVASDRQKQRQLLNKDFRKLVEESAILKKDESVADTVTGLSNPTLNGTAKVQSQNGTYNDLIGLTKLMCEAYKKYPLLCKRNERNTEGKNVGTQKISKKRKLKNLKNHQIRKPWQKKHTHQLGIDNDDCIRALAVAYHVPSKRVYYGMSGQSKKIKIHKSIWGKSLVKGRKRGTCAEFKVANQALNDGQAIDGLVINVVDIMSGDPKPRCRNCLFITKDSKCLSDDLIFDGNMAKLDL